MRISDWSSDVCSSDLAELLASSQQQAFVALRTGNPGKMKPPLAGYKDNLAPNARAILDHVLQCSAVGTTEAIPAGLKAFVTRTGVGEVVVASSQYDHAARDRKRVVKGKSVAIRVELGGRPT